MKLRRTSMNDNAEEAMLRVVSMPWANRITRARPYCVGAWWCFTVRPEEGTT
jgi:hypothetical protein